MAFFYLLLSLALASVINCRADLIDDVCAKSINPSFCKDTLRSNPRSRGAGLQILAQIALDRAGSATGATIQVAKTFASGATKEKAETCVETCNDAIDNLNECRRLLSAGGGGSSGDLQTKASAALTDISTCDDEFGPSEPPQLKQASTIAQNSVDVVLVVVNRL